MTETELIQIKPTWDAYNNNCDVNKWSRIHPRFKDHDGCIVDLGCLGWNKSFEDETSENWSGYFFETKRVIGVDPQEQPNPKAEFFKGFVSNFSGKADLILADVRASSYMTESPTGQYDVLSWVDFKNKFNINSISILKINIEGSEWDLIESFNSKDFSEIDQIGISFHDWMHPFKNKRNESRTQACINKIIENGYSVIDLGIYGWRLFLKK